LNGISGNKWNRGDFEREDVLETDILSGKRMPNSFSTTIETTTYRGHQLMEETPGTSSNMRAALRGVEFIAQHIKNQDKDNEVIEDWKFIAMVLDRLFLWLFTLACVLGTGGIILRAPSLYDMREPIDAKFSEIPRFGV